MEDKIKDIMMRRGALHVINGHRFYSEESVKNCLQEVFGLLPQPDVSSQVCRHEWIETAAGFTKCLNCNKYDDDV